MFLANLDTARMLYELLRRLWALYDILLLHVLVGTGLSIFIHPKGGGRDSMFTGQQL